MVPAPAAVLIASAMMLLRAVPADTVPVGTVELFATLPVIDQGHPMGVAVRNETAYAATGMWVGSDFLDNRPPTRGGAVYSYPLAGAPHAQPAITWRLQDPTDEQMGLDVTRDAVYTVAWDKVLRFDRRTGAQETYATLPDLPSCTTAGLPCQPADSPPREDRRPMGSGLSLAPDGTVYVADLFQGTIWRVPPGPPGRTAERWFQDERLGGQVFGGAGGMVVAPDGRSLFLAMDDDSRIYRLSLTDKPTAANLKEVFAFGSGRRPSCSFTPGADCPYPEDLAFGASGRLYVVLSGVQAVSVLRNDPSGWRQVALYPTVLRTGETTGVQTVPYGRGHRAVVHDGRDPDTVRLPRR